MAIATATTTTTTKKTHHKTAPTSNFKAVIGLTAFSLLLRLALIAHPSVAVSGESAIWRLVKNYTDGTFFTSDRPPLMTLLLAALVKLVGVDYSGGVPTYGQVYPTNLPFVQLRLLSGLFGAAVVPVAYLTLKATGLDSSVATMIAGSLALDNALVTHNRIISNDSLSILLSATTYFAWTKYYFQGKKTKWFLLLAASLGASLSCNWLPGSASILFALLYSSATLWTDFCTRVPMTTILKGSLKSVTGFVLLPLAFYLVVFAVHFSLITTGAEESLLVEFSPEFQQYFNPLPSTYGTVVYGSTITLRHRACPTLYLHSHLLTWPNGSKQQQVTGYIFADPNNDWIIREAWGERKEAGTLVHTGDLIRLQHVSTGRFLHSHYKEAPESDKEHHREVSCYGGGISSDANDNWKIELVDGHGNVIPDTSSQPINAINSTFRLFHPHANCSLSSFAKRLPEYAAGQYEVTCGIDTLRYHSVWMIESNQHDSSRGTGDLVQYRTASLFQRLLEVHKKMFETIKPKPSEDQSPPWRFSPLPIWSKKVKNDSPATASTKNPSRPSHSLRIFVLPNPVLWLLGFGSIAIFFLGCFISKARSLDGSTERSQFFHLDSYGGHAVTFWVLHTLSFLLTPNHSLVSYFPALYASIMLSAQLVKHHYLLAVSIACAVSASFYAFAPLSYGLNITPEFCERLQLFGHWKFGCSL